MSPMLCLLLLASLWGVVLPGSLPEQETDGGYHQGIDPFPKACTTVNSTYVDCSRCSLKTVPPNITVTVETLDLSHNTIHMITEDSFRGLVNLVTLLLDYNSVSKLKADFFADQGRLARLILHHNQLGKLPDDVFVHTPNLEILDLSYMNNGFLEIPGALHNLTKLSVLKLRSNRLQSATFGPKANFTALRLLDLGKNEISSLQKGDFVALANASLVRLNLTENSIQDIDVNVFHPLRSVDEIDFSKGVVPSTINAVALALSNVQVQAVYLREIGLEIWNGDNFKNLHNSSLKALDISSNDLSILNSSFTGLRNVTTLLLRNNKIADITDTAFSGLGLLQMLDLSGNSFVTIRAGMFESLATVPVRTLYLNKSTIKSLDDADAFRGLLNLTCLKLSKNKITQRLNGEEFNGLDSLEELDLGVQDPEEANLSLSADAFRHVPHLKVLYLNLVNLKNITVRPSPFNSLRALQKLDLSNNNMAAMDVDVFSNLHTLQTLYLQHNNLYNMWNLTIHVPFLKSLYNLKYLDLCYNGFQNIPNTTLRNLRQLDSLYLCHNQINHFEDNIFNGLNVTTLDLAYNQINLINSTLLQPIESTLKTLYVSNNPFSCGCDLRWFRHWLDVTEVHVSDLNKCRCSSPPSMRGTHLTDFHPETLNCDHRLPLYSWILIGVGSVTIITAVLLAIRFRWYIKYYYYLINAKRRKYIRLEGEDREFKYDAFVSFCHKDQDWIESELVPNLEGSGEFRMCIHDRDFLLGKKILDSIVEAIDSSRFTLCLLSVNYLDSHWCKMEREFAMANLIHRDVLILIVLGDIPKDKWTRYYKLHKVMKNRTYLPWPAEPGRERDVFWQKLKDVLRDPNERVDTNHSI